MKIIFMGTPNFAVPSLEALNENMKLCSSYHNQQNLKEEKEF